VRDMQQVSSQLSTPFTAVGSPALAADFPHKNRAAAILYTQISSFNGIRPEVITRAIGHSGLGINTETLTDYRVPTLFISADGDLLFPAAYIEALATTLAGAEFINLGDAGHSSYFEKPAEFNTALEDFLARLGD